MIRQATAQAMRVTDRQFVLGEDVETGMPRARAREKTVPRSACRWSARGMPRARAREKTGVTHSYDMLGEAARTHADAGRYRIGYAEAIAARAAHDDIAPKPDLSVKLSALHPRYGAA